MPIHLQNPIYVLFCFLVHMSGYKNDLINFIEFNV